MDHKNQPFVYNAEVEAMDLGNGATRKVLAYGDGLMCCELHFETGTVGAMHQHPHAQCSYIISGVFEFTIGGVKKIVKAGDTLYQSPNVEHGCVCLEEGVLLDIFAPMREDFV